MSGSGLTGMDIPSDIERVVGILRGVIHVVWQFIVLVVASIGFPVATLLFLIGGPRFPDEPRDAR